MHSNEQRQKEKMLFVGLLETFHVVPDRCGVDDTVHAAYRRVGDAMDAISADRRRRVVGPSVSF